MNTANEIGQVADSDRVMLHVRGNDIGRQFDELTIFHRYLPIAP